MWFGGGMVVLANVLRFCGWFIAWWAGNSLWFAGVAYLLGGYRLLVWFVCCVLDFGVDCFGFAFGLIWLRFAGVVGD